VIDDHIKNRATITFVSANIISPFGLGRVLRNKTNEVIGIIEEKEASNEQKKITEVNCGHFIFNKDWLLKNIEKNDSLCDLGCGSGAVIKEIRKFSMHETYAVDYSNYVLNKLETLDFKTLFLDLNDSKISEI
jgi:ADP-glucose pyrophosphorylase